METIHITNDTGGIIDTVKRKIHELMIHTSEPNTNGFAIQSGWITYKGKRILAGLEEQDGTQRWKAFAPFSLTITTPTRKDFTMSDNEPYTQIRQEIIDLILNPHRPADEPIRHPLT